MEKNVQDGFDSMDEKFEKLFAYLGENMATKSDIRGLKEEINELKSKTDTLVSAVDNLVKNIEDLKIEYIAVKTQLDRHEKWIKEIAEQAGVKLS